MAKSKDELVRILKSNIKAFNKYRDDTNNDLLDLSDADLTGTNLCRVNLENVILKDAELNFAYLHSANLKNSDLSDLTVGRADMTETDLSGSKMESTDLTNTILYGANLSGIKAPHLILEGAKVREVNFANADLTNANLSNVDLNGVNFESANITGTDFTGSNLSNALNLNTAKFDNTTIWPDAQSLPDNFEPLDGGGQKMPSFENIEFEEDTGFNTDFGPGVTSEVADYEFLDGPLAPKEDEPMTDTTTQFNSPFDMQEEDTINDDFEELPDFEQFTFEDGPNFQEEHSTEIDQNEPGLAIQERSMAEEFIQEPGLAMEEPGTEDFMLEPGLAIEEPGLAIEEPGLGGFEEIEELGGLNEDDAFSSSFTDSFESLSAEKTETSKLGSIADQNFPVRSETKEEAIAPLKDKPVTPPKPAPIKTTLSSKPVQKPGPTPMHEPPPAPEPIPEPAPEIPAPPVIQEVQTSINTEQMDTLMSVLNNITNKLDNIEKEQGQQKKAIEELKKTQQEQKLAPQPSEIKPEVITTQIEDLSSSTKNLFSRMESKIDIIVQTDPLDQIDSLLGELADTMQEEQEKLETSLEGKIVDISSSIEALIALMESEETTGPSDIDFTELINNTHQMLINLESNIKEDQEKADQKIEDMATIIDGMSIVLENLPSDTSEKLKEMANSIDGISMILETLPSDPSEKLDSLSSRIDSIGLNTNNINSAIIDLNDTVNNVNNTVGTIIELSQINQEDNAESQIYEAFYDFEFRLQLELEKNQNKLTNLENLFIKTNENIEKINQHSAKFDEFSIEKLDKIPQLLNSIKKELATEIEHTEQHTTALKNTIDDMIIQLESIFSIQLEGLQRYVGKELSNIKHIIQDDKTNVELNKKVDALLQIDSQTQANLENLGINIESILNSNNQLGAIISNINSKLGSLNHELIAIDNKVEATRQESKIDDETRSVFEHVLLQINESGNNNKKSNEVLTKKVEDMELDLQMTLKDMDRRINKINSMIRNVYKALDSITDLITESSRSSLSLNKTKSKLQKDEDL